MRSAPKAKQLRLKLLSQADFGRFIRDGWENLNEFRSGMGIFAFAERQFDVLRRPQKYNLDKNFDRVAWLFKAEGKLPTFLPAKRLPWGQLMCFKPTLADCPKQQYRQALLSVCAPADILTRNYHDGSKLYEFMCTIAASAPGARDRDQYALDSVSIPSRGFVATQTTDHLGEILLDHLPHVVSKDYLINAARFRGYRSLRKAFHLLNKSDSSQASSAALHILSRHLAPPELGREFLHAAHGEFLRDPPSCIRDACTASLNLSQHGLVDPTVVNRLAQQLGSDALWEERDQKILTRVHIHREQVHQLEQTQTLSLELF